jgi:hypothetical protein
MDFWTLVSKWTQKHVNHEGIVALALCVNSLAFCCLLLPSVTFCSLLSASLLLLASVAFCCNRRGNRSQQKATEGNRRQQKATASQPSRTEGNRRQQKATEGNRRQHKATEGNRRQQKATEEGMPSAVFCLLSLAFRCLLFPWLPRMPSAAIFAFCCLLFASVSFCGLLSLAFLFPFGRVLGLLGYRPARARRHEGITDFLGISFRNGFLFYLSPLCLATASHQKFGCLAGRALACSVAGQNISQFPKNFAHPSLPPGTIPRHIFSEKTGFPAPGIGGASGTPWAAWATASASPVPTQTQAQQKAPEGNRRQQKARERQHKTTEGTKTKQSRNSDGNAKSGLL